MKICIVTTAFPRWPGDDRGSFILNASRALVEKGIDVRVIAIHSPGSRHHEMMNGIEVIRPSYLPEKWEILQNEGGGLPVVWKKYPLARLALIPFVIVQSLAVSYYGRDCDIIHGNWTLSGTIAHFSGLFHRRPCIVTVHGSDIYQALKINWVRIITRLTLQKIDQIIAVSHDLAQRTADIGIPLEKIAVIPDGINPDQFYPGNEERDNYLLFVGSLIPRKGVTYLLRAFQQVLKVCPEMRLIIAGEGPLEERLKQEAASMKIVDRICFRCAVPQQTVAELMRRARLFILPSSEEGLGVVLLEALASGTPIVGSKVGGIPDVVTPDVGILVPPGDPEALASAILKTINDPMHWQGMSEASRKRAVEVFSWSNIADRLLGLYQHTLQRKQGS